jgi:asparagine synthase (glutamine-hydrolysing)
LLRDLLRTRLPKEIVREKKLGFTPPLTVWLKGGLYDWAADVLGGQAFADLNVVRPAMALQYLQTHREGGADHNRFLWPCVMLGLWAERAKESRIG